MVKLETYRRKGRAVDYRKCTAVAAVLSALIVVGVELVGGPVAPANARFGTAEKTTPGVAPTAAPAAVPR